LSTDGYLDSARIRQCWKEHPAGRLDVQAKLWNALMFQSWLDYARAETRAQAGTGSVAANALPVTVATAVPATPVAHRPQRVLHAIHSLSGGGAETQLRMLLNSWSYPDVETGVFYVAGDRADITNPAVDLFPSRQSSTRHVDYLRSMFEAIETFDPDVIQIWLPEAVAIPAMLVGRLQGRKVILSYRNRRNFHRPLTYIEAGLAVFCVDSIVSNHEVLTAPSYVGSIFRWLFERKRGLVIRNGIAIDGSKLMPAAMELRPVMRFVCVGRLTPVKNYPRLVEALRLLADRQDWSLDIWGEGESRPDLEQAIASSGLGDRILLRGYSDAVHLEMLRASALILPSLSEGMPNALMEAMALGLPVIAADIEGVREVVRNEQACVWIDPLDPHDIASRISSVLDGEVDLPGLAARSRLIADRYSITAAQADYRKLYRDLLRAR
jgi:glycosyltransferase involved in cell wall biosynthesis